MSDKAIVSVVGCVVILLVVMAHEAASVGKARAAVEVERVKACAAAGKQMQPIAVQLGAHVSLEMECK